MNKKETWERLLQIGVVEGPMAKEKWDLSEAHLTWAYLREADLVGACLDGAYLRGADLTGADLTGSDITGARLTGANLRGANLVGADLTGANVGGVDLRDANLYGAGLSALNLTSANLMGAGLAWADLHDANLRGLDLGPIDLTGANLTGANLRGTNLTGASLRFADLTGASLSGANLAGANLAGLDLSGCDLAEANLAGADLHEANLRGVELARTDLRNADLRGCDLSSFNLIGAHMAHADLTGANMAQADLTGADLSHCRLVNVDLRGAKLKDCLIHAVLARNLSLENAVQSGFVISPRGQPAITVDDLKVAQLISLFLYSPGVFDLLDTVTSKIVLILGRFTGERRPVANMLRRRLRERNYAPLLVEVEDRENDVLKEAVALLAPMARFVIADITETGGIPGELRAVLPGLSSVPVQFLYQGTSRGDRVFDPSKEYPWVLPVYCYKDVGEAIAALVEKVLLPAEAGTGKKEEQSTLWPEGEGVFPEEEAFPLA